MSACVKRGRIEANPKLENLSNDVFSTIFEFLSLKCFCRVLRVCKAFALHAQKPTSWPKCVEIHNPDTAILVLLQLSKHAPHISSVIFSASVARVLSSVDQWNTKPALELINHPFSKLSVFKLPLLDTELLWERLRKITIHFNPSFEWIDTFDTSWKRNDVVVGAMTRALAKNVFLNAFLPKAALALTSSEELLGGEIEQGENENVGNIVERAMSALNQVHDCQELLLVLNDDSGPMLDDMLDHYSKKTWLPSLTSLQIRLDEECCLSDLMTVEQMGVVANFKCLQSFTLITDNYGEPYDAPYDAIMEVLSQCSSLTTLHVENTYSDKGKHKWLQTFVDVNHGLQFLTLIPIQPDMLDTVWKLPKLTHFFGEVNDSPTREKLVVPFEGRQQLQKCVLRTHYRAFKAAQELIRSIPSQSVIIKLKYGTSILFDSSFRDWACEILKSVKIVIENLTVDFDKTTLLLNTEAELRGIENFCWFASHVRQLTINNLNVVCGGLQNAPNPNVYVELMEKTKGLLQSPVWIDKLTLTLVEIETQLPVHECPNHLLTQVAISAVTHQQHLSHLCLQSSSDTELFKCARAATRARRTANMPPLEVSVIGHFRRRPNTERKNGKWNYDISFQSHMELPMISRLFISTNQKMNPCTIDSAIKHFSQKHDDDCKEPVLLSSLEFSTSVGCTAIQLSQLQQAFRLYAEKLHNSSADYFVVQR